MSVLYGMVLISLALSLLFLRFFFWAVDNDQLSSIEDRGIAILDDDKKGLSDE